MKSYGLVETEVSDFLVSKGIYPFSVLFSEGILKISVYLPQDIDEILGIINYKTLCDVSGIEIYQDTILFRGNGIYKFLRYVNN